MFANKNLLLIVSERYFFNIEVF